MNCDIKFCLFTEDESLGLSLNNTGEDFVEFRLKNGKLNCYYIALKTFEADCIDDDIAAIAEDLVKLHKHRALFSQCEAGLVFVIKERRFGTEFVLDSKVIDALASLNAAVYMNVYQYPDKDDEDSEEKLD